MPKTLWVVKIILTGVHAVITTPSGGSLLPSIGQDQSRTTNYYPDGEYSEGLSKR